MKLLTATLLVLFSLYYSIVARAGTAQPKAKSKTAETRRAQALVSKRLYAKLKAQALNEARAELAQDEADREAAKLDALQELDAGATDVTEPRPNTEGAE